MLSSFFSEDWNPVLSLSTAILKLELLIACNEITDVMQQRRLMASLLKPAQNTFASTLKEMVELNAFSTSKRVSKRKRCELTQDSDDEEQDTGRYSFQEREFRAKRSKIDNLERDLVSQNHFGFLASQTMQASLFQVRQ